MATATSPSGRSRAWRLYGRLAAERLNRAPYYGIGNEAPEVDSLNGLDPPYYRYQLLRSTAYGVYERAIVRHVRLHVAPDGGVELALNPPQALELHLDQARDLIRDLPRDKAVFLLQVLEQIEQSRLIV